MQPEQLYPLPVEGSYIQVHYESSYGYTRILYTQRWLILPLQSLSIHEGISPPFSSWNERI